MNEALSAGKQGAGSRGLPEVGLLISAGEASGDLHAARLLDELVQLVPGVRAFGLGGSELEGASMELVAESSEISVVGIAEALKIVPRAREIFHQLLAEVDARGTRVALLIDFPEFNLRLARALKRRGLTVIYYISPQVWAWRRRRVRTIAKVVDAMLVVFPFEVDFYRRHGVDAIHVGHPLVDEVPELPQIWDHPEQPDPPYRVALLPGSRSSEIEANLPVMLQAIEALSRRLTIEVVLVQAKSVSGAQVRELVAQSTVNPRIATTSRFEEIAQSHLALCASGTATLEVGLLTTPMVVVYRVHAWTYALGRLLVKLPHISLVNLVLGVGAVPELIQADARPERIAAEAQRILEDRDRMEEMRRELGRLRSALGASGASAKAAAHARDLLLANASVAVDDRKADDAA